ncbi:hypothetical protein G7054_g5141 [Neopestalotiopsis clavispora]|nr:hypothetical protein G7054_g5141 [Neopestalotiopsis clavispora]
MPPKTQPSDPEWENRKETIRKLYVGEDLTLQAVRKQMEHVGFIATKSQYEARFKEWGFSKNVPVKTWKHIGLKIGKRKREGKQSAVSVNGIQIPLKKVKKETSRHYYSSRELIEVEKNNAPSPLGPLVVVATPPSSQDVLMLDRPPTNLPWFSSIRFLDIFLEMPLLQQNPHSSHDWLPYTPTQIQVNEAIEWRDLRIMNPVEWQEIYGKLKIYAHFDLNHISVPYRPNTERPADIHTSMFLKPTSTSHWGLNMIVYMASNKLLKFFHIDRIWQMIEESGLKQLANVSNSSCNNDTSLAAAMECLFAAGIDKGHAELVSWLLETGVSPNMRVRPPSYGELHLPLTIAMEESIENVRPASEMVSFLLSKGASLVLICCQYHGSPTQYLLENIDQLETNSRTDSLEILDAFLKAATALNLSPESRSLQHPYLQDVLNACPSVPDQIGDVHHQKMDQLVDLIQEFSAKTPDLSASLITPRSLIRAVECRNERLIRIIHNHGLPMDCCDENDRLPLQAAVEATCIEQDIKDMDLSIIYILLELGASPDYNPIANNGNSCSPVLHSAIKTVQFCGGMIEVIKSLIDHGALVQGRTPCSESGHRTLMDCALSKESSGGLMEVVAVLYNAGLTLPNSALVTALELGYENNLPLKDEEYEELCRVMLDGSQDLFVRSERGWTALDYAVLMKKRRLEKLLVINGAEHTREFAYIYCQTKRFTLEKVARVISRIPDAQDTGQWKDLLFCHLVGTFRASNLKNGSLEYVAKLLNHYAMLPGSSTHGATLIETACGSEQPELIAITLQMVPYTYSSTALSALIRSEVLNYEHRRAFIQDLLRRRANASLNPLNERRMFFHAINGDMKGKGDARALEWFSTQDIEALRKENLHSSAFAIRAFRRNVSSESRDGNASCEERDLKQWSKFRLSASSYLGVLVAYIGQVEKVSALLKQEFRPNRRISWTLTALQIAVAKTDRPMTLRLLESGCDVNARPPWKDIPASIASMIWTGVQTIITSHDRHTRRRTALQLAVENGNLSIINLLLDFGADVNGPPARVEGATALQLACIKGYIEIAKLLITKGADVNAAGAEYFGRTALEGAAEHGRLDVVCLLLDHECRIEGSFRGQYIRAVGFARSEGHHVLSRFLQGFGAWKEEDEHLLKQTDLRDKEPESRDLEEHLQEDEEISEVDADAFECDSDDSFWVEIDEESDPEDYKSACEDMTPSGNCATRQVKHSLEGPQQSIGSLPMQRPDWDELIEYFGDDEEESL